MRLVAFRGKWHLRIDGRRLSTGIAATPDRRADAERVAREIARRIVRPELSACCADIVCAYLEDWKNRPAPKRPGSGTIYGAQNVLAVFAGHQPHQITREECRAYVAARRDAGAADGTIRRELGILAAALRWNGSPPASFELPPPSPPRQRWLTREEVARLLDAAQTTPHVHAFIHLAIATGARREAILELQWETHIDFKAGRVWLGFKEGGKGRATVPMTDALRLALHNGRQIATTPWVIEYAGKPVRSIRKALAGVYARAGVEGVDAPAHVLRHTAGAWMAQAGVPMLEISRRLGHASIATTEKHYAHLHPDFMQASTKALEI